MHFLAASHRHVKPRGYAERRLIHQFPHIMLAWIINAPEASMPLGLFSCILLRRFSLISPGIRAR